MAFYAKVRERAGVVRIEMRWDRASGFEHETVYLREYNEENKEELISRMIGGVMKKAKKEGTLKYV